VCVHLLSPSHFLDPSVLSHICFRAAKGRTVICLKIQSMQFYLGDGPHDLVEFNLNRYNCYRENRNFVFGDSGGGAPFL
jgi:hypothetical protein